MREEKEHANISKYCIWKNTEREKEFLNAEQAAESFKPHRNVIIYISHWIP